MSEVPFGEDRSLLQPPTATIESLEEQARAGGFSPGTVAQLPKFLRSFFLRFLDEIVEIKIERFSLEERDQVSDLVVDLEARYEKPAAWPLLSDFVDLCDYFEDFGLMSVPDAAQEHEVDLLELTARVLHDLGTWAKKEGHEKLLAHSHQLAEKLDRLLSGGVRT